MNKDEYTVFFNSDIIDRWSYLYDIFDYVIGIKEIHFKLQCRKDIVEKLTQIKSFGFIMFAVVAEIYEVQKPTFENPIIKIKLSGDIEISGNGRFLNIPIATGRCLDIVYMDDIMPFGRNDFIKELKDSLDDSVY